MDKQENLNLYLMVEEGTGRQFIGKLVERNDAICKLDNPLLIVERVLQQAQNSQQSQIALNISPIMHTFNIDTWEFKWSGCHKITDERLISSYEKYSTQIRAARSGLSVAQQVPTTKLAAN